MKQLTGLPLGILLALVFVALLWTPEHSPLQAEQPAASAADDAQDQTSAAPKQRKKPRGRLPVFYSQVVSGDQREEIYGIQARYQPEMDALVEQLVEMRNQMQAEIQEVLTPEQLERVQQLKDEAKQRRAERAAKKQKEAE